MKLGWIVAALIAAGIAALVGCSIKNSSDKQQVQVAIVWRLAAQKDRRQCEEGELRVAGLLGSRFLVLSSLVRGNKPSGLRARIVDRYGLVQQEVDIALPNPAYSLAGVDPVHERVALNNFAETKAIASILDIKTGHMMRLPSRYVFPLSSGGMCQPFSPDGKRVVVGRIRESTDIAHIVDSISGKAVREAKGIPTSRGAILRWRSDNRSLMWFDPGRGVMKTEQSGSKQEAAKLPIPWSRYYASLSTDGSRLVAFPGTKGRLVAQLYSTASGRLIGAINQAIGRNERLSTAVWSIDGSRVALGLTDEQTMTGGTAAYVVSASGQLQSVRVSGWQIVGDDSALSWSPDSRHLMMVVHPRSNDLVEASRHQALAVATFAR